MSIDRHSLNKLAELLAMPEGLALIRQLQQSGSMEADSPTFETKGPGSDTGQVYRDISIWKPKLEPSGWVFERPEVGPYGDHYSQVMRFCAKKSEGCIRIAFFGESVAAGYLYAPYLTPAKVLAAQLGLAFPGAKFEILDFSRTNETLGGLTLTAKAAFQVDPDMMIFFAGNNFPLLEMTEWTPHFPSVSRRQVLAQHWRSDGMVGLKAWEQRVLSQRVGGALDHLAGWCKARHLPAIWMIPEVNLLDWDHAQPPPWLPGGNLKHWYALLAEARAAMAGCRFREAIDMAWGMLALDGGTSPVGYRILGVAQAELGCLDLAREAFRFEVQAAGYVGSCFLGAPQVTTQMRALIEKVWTRYELEVVNLAEVFRKIRPDHLPDRFFFLDYCHLTKVGMGAAMGALLPSIGACFELGPPLPGSERHLPEVAAEVDSLAYLGAAIHSSHRQFPTFPDRLPWRDWMEKAVSSDKGAIAKLGDYVALRTRPAPPVFTEIQDREAASKAPFTPQHGWFYDAIDAPLLVQAAGFMAECDPELELAWMDALVDWRFEHDEVVDLLDPPSFLWEPLARFMPDVMARNTLPKPAFLRCPWPTTKFAVIWDGSSPQTLSAVLRRPGFDRANPQAPVEFRVGNQVLARIEIGNQWARHVVPLVNLKRGLNCLEIHWPIPNAGVPEEIAAELALGREARFHPYFGEIFSLEVAPIQMAPVSNSPAPG